MGATNQLLTGMILQVLKHVCWPFWMNISPFVLFWRGIYIYIYIICHIYIYTWTFQFGCQMVLKGVNEPSLRVYSAPLGRCWYIVMNIYIYRHTTTDKNAPCGSWVNHFNRWFSTKDRFSASPNLQKNRFTPKSSFDLPMQPAFVKKHVRRSWRRKRRL